MDRRLSPKLSCDRKIVRSNHILYRGILKVRLSNLFLSTNHEGLEEKLYSCCLSYVYHVVRVVHNEDLRIVTSIETFMTDAR